MLQDHSSENESSYAKFYGDLPAYSGTRYIFIRDLPTLIKRCVNGVVALDYGCGAGHSTLFLKKHGLKAEGVDINKHMVQRAKDIDTNGIYTTIRSGEIPAKDEHYDFVFSSLVLMHVPSKQELLKITVEIARVLKPGGTFIFIVNNKDAYNKEWYSLDTRFEENRNLSSGSVVKILMKENNFVIHCYYWSNNDYREVLTKAGLKVICTHKPLGTKLDGYKWINEYQYSYVTIYVTQKMKHL